MSALLYIHVKISTKGNRLLYIILTKQYKYDILLGTER